MASLDLVLYERCLAPAGIERSEASQNHRYRRQEIEASCTSVSDSMADSLAMYHGLSDVPA